MEKITITIFVFLLADLLGYAFKKTKPFPKGWWIPGSGIYYFFKRTK